MFCFLWPYCLWREWLQDQDPALSQFLGIYIDHVVDLVEVRVGRQHPIAALMMSLRYLFQQALGEWCSFLEPLIAVHCLPWHTLPLWAPTGGHPLHRRVLECSELNHPKIKTVGVLYAPEVIFLSHMPGRARVSACLIGATALPARCSSLIGWPPLRAPRSSISTFHLGHSCQHFVWAFDAEFGARPGVGAN